MVNKDENVAFMSAKRMEMRINSFLANLHVLHTKEGLETVSIS